MRSLSSVVLSLTAMVLSSMTTYLTFFDSRYTLTTAISGVEWQMQTGSSSSNGERDVYFRKFVDPAIIVSNRGTRPLVLTNVVVVDSTNPETCVPGEKAFPSRIEAKIIEPGTVQQIPLSLGIGSVEATADASGYYDLTDTKTLWCLKWTIFDPNGRRHEPISPAFTETTKFAQPETPEDYASGTFTIEYPKQPTKLVSRGLF